MAIAYKSQGAGAATETSGAACSPASPATVDAGDILIVHAYFEGTTTAPDTPSGFTLLSGPIAVETVGRHWVYGKIAAGTEDGAANALGTQAVTTMRSGRCYSFSGRVAGTITELVVGFATTSHATDPQMPTVTTTVTGALAVALVAQNDNNAFASPTGESGGDWVEAVAEFTAALTPGLSLGIETCTPTANPGTVSGGSMATTNDPCGVIGFEIKPSNNQVVTPSTASLTTTKFAPVIKWLITVAKRSLALTTFAPTVTIGTPNIVVTPATRALSTVKFAPVLKFGIIPQTRALVTTKFAPTAQLGIRVTPATRALVSTSLAPTIVLPKVVVITTRALSDTQFAPSVTTGKLVVIETLNLGGGGASPVIVND